MNKEKWMISEINSWVTKDVINEETANELKAMYQTKKNVNLLMILFSIIGSLLIGMGIVLVSANNWWYSLPIAIRTFIGFLPLLLSQMLVFYVYSRKMNNVAFRESAAILNLAGVFASIAIVGQIFHLPGDFTNYLLICGILFMPTMIILDTFSPLIIYYWSAINGGIFFSKEIGIIISIVMFLIGGVYAIYKCRTNNSKSIYLSFITVISGFVLIFISALECNFDLSIVLFAYVFLIFSAAPLLKGCKDVFSSVGKLIFIVLTFVFTYKYTWLYIPDFNGITLMVVTILLIILAVLLFTKNILSKNSNEFMISSFVLFLLRGIWCIIPALRDIPYHMIFMIIFNLTLFVLSIYLIISGAKKIDLYNANLGMITLCTLITLRFFDSQLPLWTRGIVFLVLGAGFLLFNFYLVKTKKRIKEEVL